jgi:hypothetical protein
MSRIEVDTGGLRATGSNAVATGSEVTRLAAQVRGVVNTGAGSPPATEGALQAFGSAWVLGLGLLGEGIRSVGLSADAAAALYQQADSGSMCPTSGGAG